MSSAIRKNKISMTRGDTFKATVEITTLEGEPYEPSVGDSIRFAVKHPRYIHNRGEFYDPEPLIIKDIPTDTLILELDPEDTKSLHFGKYVYDIELTYNDGTVDTVVPVTDFILTPEVE